MSKNSVPVNSEFENSKKKHCNQSSFPNVYVFIQVKIKF